MRGLSRVVLGVSLATAIAGCKASVSLHASTPAAEGAAARRVEIVRRGDRLHYEGGEIEFETGSAELKGESTTHVLDEFAEAMKRFPELALRIEAHTDSRGSRESNRRLSDERARAIRTALVRRGVPGARLAAVGHGEDRPTQEEPEACRNRSETTIAAGQVDRCHEVWSVNRRAEFVVTEGAGSLPAEGASVSRAAPVRAASARRSVDRPDWALRMFGGYSLAFADPTLHGGHLGVGVHASRRFGAWDHGFIGGGPRLHYRGMHGEDRAVAGATALTLHTIGPEGNLLIGGGSERVVGLFSLRVGLGAALLRGHQTTAGVTASLDDVRLAGWAFAGVVVLGKITRRWSLGGHVETGVVGSPGQSIALELGLNAAWHFGVGRRRGI